MLCAGAANQEPLTVDCLKVLQFIRFTVTESPKLSLHPHKEGRQRASAQKGLFPYSNLSVLHICYKTSLPLFPLFHVL